MASSAISRDRAIRRHSRSYRARIDSSGTSCPRRLTRNETPGLVAFGPGDAGLLEFAREIEACDGVLDSFVPGRPHDGLCLFGQSVVGAAAREHLLDGIVGGLAGCFELLADARPVVDLLGRAAAVLGGGLLRVVIKTGVDATGQCCHTHCVEIGYSR